MARLYLHPPTLAKRAFLLLFLSIIAFYLFGLGLFPLVGPDEPRYAQVAREMFVRGDVITPTLGGRTWFEKPALLYWMMISAYRVFGVNEFSARLGPAICALLTVLAVWWLMRAVERSSDDESLNGVANWSALSLATMLGMIVFSRGATFDVVLTMTITWSLVFFLLADLSPSKRRRTVLLAAFYAAIGLSLLAKGLLGFVIPFGVVGLYYLAQRRVPAKELLISLFWGIPLAVAVGSIWYGPVITRHGWTFIDQFFIQHHFERYVSNKYQHPQRVYFYLVIIILLTLPWTPFLIDSLVKARLWKWRDGAPVSRTLVFAVSWLVFPLVFFSMSRSKLPGYILPVLPAAAMLIGHRMARTIADPEARRWPQVAAGIVLVVLAIGGVVYGSRSGIVSPRTVVLLSLPMLIGGICAVVLRRHASASLMLVAVSILLSLVLMLRFAAPVQASRESVRDLLLVADAQGYGDAPVFIRPGADRTAEFYAAGRIVYDDHGQPKELEELWQVMAETRRRSRPIVVLVPLEYLGPYRHSNDVRILADNGNVALVIAGE